MTGLFVTGSGVGGLIMPPLANWLILSHGWRISYVILGSAVLVIIVIAALFLKRDPSQTNQLPYGAKNIAGDKSVTQAKGFAIREAVRTNQFWLVYGIFFCFSLAANTMVLHLVPHITDIGISPTTAAMVMAAMNGLGIVGRLALGGMADRIGNKRVYVVTFTLLVISYLWVMFAGELWMFFVFAIIFGLGYGSGLTQPSPVVANIFGLKSHGLIFGIMSTGYTLGAAAGTITAGYLFDINGSYQWTFVIGSAVCVIGLLLTVGLKPMRSYSTP
jgi:predicted MFS family arabinose efflux permease